MKKTLILGIFLLAVIVAGMVFLSNEQQGATAGTEPGTFQQLSVESTSNSNDIAGRLSHNLVMKNPAKATVNSVLLYKTQPPNVNKEATFALAKKFNVTGTLRGETAIQSDDLVFGVQLTKNSGSAEYMNARRPNEHLDAPKYLPSDEDAIKIATKFLKDRDLYPEGAGDPTTYRENAYSDEDTVTFGQIGVWYHRVLDGLNVEGTQYVVYVGGNGDVIGYYANWRDYEPYKDMPVISPEVAFEKLATKGVPVGMNPTESRVSIEDIYLAYHTNAGAYEEDYLEPIWVFEGDVIADGKSVMPVKEYIPALSEDSVKSLSSP